MTQRPILLDIPDSFESKRLVICALRPGDGTVLNQAILESLEELRPWLPWASQAPSLADSEEFARNAAVNWLARREFVLALWRKDTGEYVGGSGMHRIDWEVPSVEIGYWLRTSQVGQGFVTEAVNTITAFAFNTLGAHRVEIHCDERNTRSAAVARRAGFEVEARLRNHRRNHLTMALCNTMIFAKVRDTAN